MTTPTVGSKIVVGEPSGFKNLQQREAWQRNLPKFLNQLGLLVQKEIIKKLNSTRFKHQTGTIQNSIKFKAQPEKNRVIIYADIGVAPHAVYQERGVQKHQMVYLSTAVRPIPLAGKPGTTWRWASKKSMDEGKWVHPGYPGKFFFRDGVMSAIKLMNQQLKRLVINVVSGQ